ncbi:multicomponent Na+:H+ antiporter subunit B [Bhargavaea ginsengi]|uniref:Multicomponent Na+:H+ antiporter subunit B n=1 Tax=Bhargavaea ginsengi TaxID=426757 RepID=A0A1H7C1Y5_9BACL|nr:Na(+)/H(+) antiporter subunit B [Bhargavaea ginsengi]MCM3087688.1 Na(+)/H(+) antiporter subunit B [Bhargavaea ginsengi]SEJ83809.1 multicomponent Na+:H+ antiporter subunit B [Bhargavaea ginsengi]
MKSSDVILQTATKVVFFLIFLFAIHIFFAGHYTPGGGFVGGLLTASAIVLLLLAFDLKTVSRALPFNYTIMIAIGLLLALGTASASILFDVPFFTHAYDYFDLPLFGETSLHSAMLFDLGVYLVVVGATMNIILTIGSDD